CQLTLQEAKQEQGHDAEETVNADLLVGPVIHRPPAAGLRIFHGAKAILQLVLSPITEDDVFARPSDLIGEEDGLSKQASPEAVLLFLIHLEAETNSGTGVFHLGGQELLHVAGMADGLHLAADGSHGGRLARGSGLS